MEYGILREADFGIPVALSGSGVWDPYGSRHKNPLFVNEDGFACLFVCEGGLLETSLEKLRGLHSQILCSDSSTNTQKQLSSHRRKVSINVSHDF